MRPHLSVFLSLMWCVLSCGSGDAGFSPAISHTFEPVDLEVGGELRSMCQSWTLDNDETLHVSRIRQENEGGWHHSNWMYVPEERYPGPDGTWPCQDRGFDQAIASILGGVFFAQSTQAADEIQAFPEGAVIEIPPRSKIIGNIHVLNLTSSAISSSITLEAETIPAEDVKIKLRPVAFTNEALEISPMAESRFSMTCDFTNGFRVLGEDKVPDYNIYYVLPHYHELGTYFRLSFVNRDGSEQTIFETGSAVGDPLGAMIRPPISSQSAPGLRMTCGYKNPTENVIGYGFGGAEMCVFLAYVDLETTIGAQGTKNTPMGQNADDVHMNEGDCTILAVVR